MSRSVQERARAMAKTHLRSHLRRVLGAEPDEPIYPRLSWLKARVHGVMDRQPIFRGVRVEWDSPMHGWCVPFDIAGPGKDEVLVRTLVSAVSSGTELAVYSARPNTGATFPTYPGYSGVGEIVRVGRNVHGLRVGQVVAGQVAHASLAMLKARDTFLVPPQVPVEGAALTHIGIISLYGVRRAHLHGDERVAVFGRGIIGRLAGQIARSLGAGEIISVARSGKHVTLSLREQVDQVLITSNSGQRDAARHLEADVTFEVTGDPAALHDAVLATRRGGRVVLLGSSRGITQGFDFGGLADRNVSLVGANIRTLMDAPGDRYHRAGEEFLQMVADGAIDTKGLIDFEANPWEAGWFYRQLAEGLLSCVAPILRWDQLAAANRRRRVMYWSGPDVEAIRSRTMMLPPVGVAG